MATAHATTMRMGRPWKKPHVIVVSVAIFSSSRGALEKKGEKLTPPDGSIHAKLHILCHESLYHKDVEVQAFREKTTNDINKLFGGLSATLSPPL